MSDPRQNVPIGIGDLEIPRWALWPVGLVVLALVAVPALGLLALLFAPLVLFVLGLTHVLTRGARALMPGEAPKASLPLRRRGHERHRCPYCHDDVEHAQGSVCAECRAHTHTECYEELGRCGACGGTQELGLSRRRGGEERRRASSASC